MLDLLGGQGEVGRDFAAAGADYLSVGALTHSAPAVPLTMELDASHHSKRRA